MKIKNTKLIITLLIFMTITNFISFNYIKKSQITVINNQEGIEKVDTKEARAKLTFVGDLLYERPYYTAIEHGEDKTKLLSKVKKYFLEDDISIGNMETLISDGSIELGDGYYTFSAPSYVGQEIINSGFDVLGTANNHSNDFGYKGIASTINYYKNNSNILTVGTNILNETNYDNQIIEKNGIKFGFIGYTNKLNKQNLSGYNDALNFYWELDNIRKGLQLEVDALRDQVDCLIVIIHWGNEFIFEPNYNEREIAKMLNQMGVDIVIGSHAHCIQPIEWIRSENHDTLVYYGMGNFVSADTKLSRTTEEYRKAYQFGLLSNLEVVKKDNKISIENIHSIPVISYFNKNFKDFLLIPFDEYTEEYETTHYMYYKYNFNKEFIKNTYERIISEEFR